jgi:hypothetical protein
MNAGAAQLRQILIQSRRKVKREMILETSISRELVT